MKRILHIVSSLSKNAGVISMIMNYYREIDRNSILFDFVYFKEAADDLYYREEINQLGGRIYLIDKLSLTNINQVNKEIEQIFNEYQYEIVHCHEAILVNFIQSALRKCGVKRIIAHSHSARLSNTTVGCIRNRLMTLGINKYCNDIAACSELAGEYLFGKKEFLQRGTVIVNGVDTSRYCFDEILREKTRSIYGISDNTFLLGTVGRCETIKNQSFILELIASEQLRDKDVCFLLIGEGVMYEALKQKATEKGIASKVVFAGSQDDVRPFLCAMDMFVFPSLNEGFGVALVEAQLCKLPCLANSTIPKETAISDYVQYISVDKRELWISTICEEIGKGILERDKRIFDSSNIDIKKCASRLQDFYIRG